LLDITDNLVDDLNAGIRGGDNNIQLPSIARGVDTTKLAAMAIAFEVVPA